MPNTKDFVYGSGEEVNIWVWGGGKKYGYGEEVKNMGMGRR